MEREGRSGMNRIHRVLLTGWLAAVGCITVNINFPPKEVERAAEEIVGEARSAKVQAGSETGQTAPAPAPSADAAPGSAPGGEGYTTPPPPPPPPASGAQSSATRGLPGGTLLAGLALAGAAEKKPEIQININTPVIKAIRASLTARFPKLLPLYEKGVIGESRDGYVEIRDDSTLGVKEKVSAKALVSEENKDRKNLYTEIVKENHFGEDRMRDVQKIFADQWSAKSRPGWWVQKADGSWEKKPQPRK
jgi:uncharacterized protein